MAEDKAPLISFNDNGNIAYCPRDWFRNETDFLRTLISENPDVMAVEDDVLTEVCIKTGETGIPEHSFVPLSQIPDYSICTYFIVRIVRSISDTACKTGGMEVR